MSYTDRAKSIRARLSCFQKRSVLKHILNYLHQPEENGLDAARKMPYIAHLLIEWLYQVEEFEWAREASKEDVGCILDKIFHLQSIAAPFRDHVHYELILRKMLSAQHWPQQSRVVRLYRLTRLHALTTSEEEEEGSTWFEEQFEKVNKLTLEEFYVLSLWLMIKFDENNYAIPYQRIIIELTPFFDIEKVSKFFKLISVNLKQLEAYLYPLSEQSVSIDAYFAPTALIKKPVFMLSDYITTPHHSLLTKAISEFVLMDFKARDSQRFKDKFTPIFEKYVGTVLDESGSTFIPEDVLNDLYKKYNQQGNKVVDYLIKEEDAVIFIDAKGIEPHPKVQVSDNSRILKDKLSSSFTHGVQQAFGCASTLKEIGEIEIPKKERCYALVVTHLEFYISNGKRLNDLVDPTLHEKLMEKYGDHIPIENIYFTAIDEFEGIMKICRDSECNLSAFLEFCVQADKNGATGKFDMRQHIIEFVKENALVKRGSIGTAYIKKKQEHLFKKLGEVVGRSESYWRYKGLAGMQEYSQKQHLLLKYLEVIE
ncbi:hypothetical protein [Neptuniibacter sp. 2_MG-2023]|uniref:GapS1 family protein n=1 Tax=Neptuniibacter sp. 2_MG-2023 TaxID=3062671 RepID=UPI0026E13BD8|nr:hypothetical protein [Neptuniibacter sp. 2_MG-2023]MDO6514408.1 hypothetical protein [Neptuniibacter sp. 2_MG-2023]